MTKSVAVAAWLAPTVPGMPMPASQYMSSHEAMTTTGSRIHTGMRRPSSAK